MLSPGKDPLMPRICEERGVALEQVAMRAEDEPKRLLETLWHRGVSGILLWPDPCPWRVPQLEKLPWHRFAVVKMARVRPELSFHLIRHAAFDFATLAVRRSCEAAKKRVCVLLWETDSEIDNQARVGALLAYRENRLPPGIELEWRMWQGPIDQADPGALAWLLERQPDTVLLFHYFMLHTLERGGLPEGFRPRFHAIQFDRGFPWIQRPLAGCDISRESYLRRALDLLLELIGRGERGLVAQPLELVVEPVWLD
jgi:DNA-binding LacI/PurR family transcriptional regulator